MKRALIVAPFSAKVSPVSTLLIAVLSAQSFPSSLSLLTPVIMIAPSSAMLEQLTQHMQTADTKGKTKLTIEQLVMESITAYRMPWYLKT